MNSPLYFSVKKWFAALAFLSFFAAAVFSIGIGMNMDEKGNMAPCAFMSNGVSVCPMGVSQHLDEWAGLFAPVSSMFASLLFVVILFLAVAGNSFFTRERILQKKRLLYAVNHSYLKSLYFLVFLFSRGILNPRHYKFAAI